MTVSLEPEAGNPIDIADRVFRSLDQHFYNVVNLTEVLELAEQRA